MELLGSLVAAIPLHEKHNPINLGGCLQLEQRLRKKNPSNRSGGTHIATAALQQKDFWNLSGRTHIAAAALVQKHVSQRAGGNHVAALALAQNNVSNVLVNLLQLKYVQEESSKSFLQNTCGCSIICTNITSHIDLVDLFEEAKLHDRKNRRQKHSC